MLMSKEKVYTSMLRSLHDLHVFPFFQKCFSFPTLKTNEFLHSKYRLYQLNHLIILHWGIAILKLILHKQLTDATNTIITTELLLFYTWIQHSPSGTSRARWHVMMKLFLSLCGFSPDRGPCSNGIIENSMTKSEEVICEILGRLHN